MLQEDPMRKLVVAEFLTLDGVMQAPGDPNEDRSGGFDKGGWQLDYFDDVFANSMDEGFARTGSYLFGRRTYEIFANWWPNQPDDDPLAPIFNKAPKYVVSTTLQEPLPWQNSTLISGSGDVPGEIRKLKEEDGDGKDIQVIGSGELVQTLIANYLVDRLNLLIHPLILGEGKRLFREGITPAKLRLAESVISTKGVLILTYEPAGAEAGADAGVDAGTQKTAIPVEEGQPASR
jgi:dihydrofolate reductase